MANPRKQKGFWFKQPLVGEKRCVTTLITAAKETSVMMVQTNFKLNNTELFLKLFHIQCKEIGNNKYYEETTELKKW